MNFTYSTFTIQLTHAVFGELDTSWLVRYTRSIQFLKIEIIILHRFIILYHGKKKFNLTKFTYIGGKDKYRCTASCLLHEAYLKSILERLFKHLNIETDMWSTISDVHLYTEIDLLGGHTVQSPYQKDQCKLHFAISSFTYGIILQQLPAQ